MLTKTLKWPTDVNSAKYVVGTLKTLSRAIGQWHVFSTLILYLICDLEYEDVPIIYIYN